MDNRDIVAKYQNFTHERDFSFSQNSTIGVGGYAPIAFMPKTVEECIELIQTLLHDGIPYCVVGNLSNVLPADGISKKVYVSTKNLKGIRTDNEFFVEAGVTSGMLLRTCKELSLSGAEFLEGVPCTVGGALFMNAGVQGGYIGEIVQSVLALKDGNLIKLTQSECEYAYKQSVFTSGEYVILGARLRLQVADKDSIFRRLQEYRERRAHLPKGKSMGCVFKNPQGISAGSLIEGAGLKGFRVGGAVVSTTHANFILNDQNATSAQIKSLIKIIQNAVYAQYKIQLQEEIRYLE